MHTASNHRTPSGENLVIIAAPGQEQRAERLSRQLAVPVHRSPPAGAALALEVTAAGLQLRDLRRGPSGPPGPVRVDLLGGGRERLLRAGGNSELLGRAVGARRGRRPWVVDATAGLGGDAALLAALGCRVTMLERAGVVAALLRDGLERAAAAVAAETGGTGGSRDGALLGRLQLLETDAVPWLGSLDEAGRPDVVYLDPMYPDTGRSALARKEMQVLQQLLGHDETPPALFAAARKAARQRVVVKRPRKAPALDGALPSHVISGRSTRFDVYLT